MSCSISVPFLKCKHERLWLAIIIVTVITKARVIQVTSELKFFKTHKLGSALSRYLKKNKCICCFQFFLKQWVVLVFCGSLLLHILHYYKDMQGVHTNTHVNAWQYLCDK